MLDFYNIKEREGVRKGCLDMYPDFRITRSKDLMVRAKSFYAIWDDASQLWSTDEYDVQRLVDEELYAHEQYTVGVFSEVNRKLMGNFSSNSWLQFRNYVAHLSDSSHQLDSKITFANDEAKKSDYVSKKLPYSLVKGSIEAYDELISVLFDPEERAKLEWVVGAILTGDSKKIQKFLVLYGSAGTGKSTWLMIVQWLTEGYYVTFEAKELTSANNMFSMEAFKANPLVAIQHDGDLSRIADNTKLNSIVSHEVMSINEKHKPSYTISLDAFLLIGTNTAVKITDAKSGLVRRMIDVQPTGNQVSTRKYQALMGQIPFELGAIANHCIEVYRSMGRDYYSGYRPVEMMLQTDVFFNFIEAYYDVFRDQDGATLKQAYLLYKEYCDETNIEHVQPQYKFREELKNYFHHFEERAEINGVRVRSWYYGFNADRFKVKTKDEKAFSLVMEETKSIFDDMMAEQPAQYSKDNGNPTKYWTDSEILKNGKLVTPSPSSIVSTKLSGLKTDREHYVKVPENHIVIDFDLKDADGHKSAERNLEAASGWPSTYAEFSKSEAGIHLHYNYIGDSSELSRVYADGIEVKVFTGNSSLRRKLSRCNNIPVASISSGLPLKEKKVMNVEGVKSERAIRELIQRNLRKEIHPGTKSSIDFIHKILEDTYSAKAFTYDVSDMKHTIMVFANNSSNQASTALKVMMDMKFTSDPSLDPVVLPDDITKEAVMFDVEVFPNLFVLCYKGEDQKTGVRLINPTPHQVEEVLALKLIGFNNRRYDNHILYAAMMGFSNKQLYNLSKKIINNVPNTLFGEAYGFSHADIFDYSSKKQTLKKWEIELGIRHMELGLDWDEPVPEELWDKVAEYCENDVDATIATHKARKQDYIAREILADLSGLAINDTTQQHTSKIVFGGERRPQEDFIYTDLTEMFPGYEFDMGKSTYRGEITGEGGYVYAEPGMYENTVVLDVASMHPTSIEELDLFGPYTKNFSYLKAARLAIKRGEYDDAKLMLDGKLARHLQNPDDAEDLSYALKIVINIVYGLTAAKFDNSFRDPRNIDNIVAKRGALFMIDLKHAVQEKGFSVVHIKTDSIKIPDATPEIIEFIMDFGEKYGYEFEHEATYEKFCLVNDTVYIAKTKDGREPSHWEAVGAQFAHPYVYKFLFSKEALVFDDMCETKSVTTALYLDFSDEDEAMATVNERMHFVGKTGLFTPIPKESGGGILMREKEGAFHAASGTKDYRWMESEMVRTLGKEDEVDISYYTKLVDAAIEKITKHGDFGAFVG